MRFGPHNGISIFVGGSGCSQQAAIGCQEEVFPSAGLLGSSLQSGEKSVVGAQADRHGADGLREKFCHGSGFSQEHAWGQHARAESAHGAWVRGYSLGTWAACAAKRPHEVRWQLSALSLTDPNQSYQALATQLW